MSLLDRDRMILGEWILCLYYGASTTSTNMQCVGITPAFWGWLMLTERSSRETWTRGVALERHSDRSGRWDHRSPLSTNSLQVSDLTETDSVPFSLPHSSRTVAPTFVHAYSSLCSHQGNLKTVFHWVPATVWMRFEWEGFNYAGSWTSASTAFSCFLHYCFCIGFSKSECLCPVSEVWGLHRQVYAYNWCCIIFIMWEGFRGGCAQSPRANF